ncbi:MAG: alpha/beta fold hydrolase [Parvularculaceae bacterium]|nr:alpha/beta fold hydrolase [Parvularculaceae bacterium]
MNTAHGQTEFKGFGGLTLRADASGKEDAPTILLIHAAGRSRKAWRDVGSSLALAGRHVINLDLRGHGGSDRAQDKRYDFDSYVEDLRCVLAQLPSRPVIVASEFGGLVAVAALGEAPSPLAAGLVLADAPPKLDGPASTNAQEELRRAAQAEESLDWDPACLDAVDMDNVMERLPRAAKEIRIPVLFVRGDKNELSSHQAAREFTSLFSDVEFAEIEGAGRRAATDRSDIFNALLLDFLERKAPLSPPEYIAGADPRTLRDAMGCFATGITIVTSRDADGKPIGLTANSFTSVSLDPPLLLVCIARSARSASTLEDTSHFGINILHIGQQPTSNLFSSREPDRFSKVPWENGEHGTPLLKNSLASIECVSHAVYDGGDHLILVGRVERARFELRRDPLLYFAGKYRRLHFG